MTTRRTIASFVLLALVIMANAQHSPLTSQYLFNGLLINPAYAGSRDALAANLTNRFQWVGMQGAPVTQIASVHAPVNKRKVGLGAVLYNDRLGVSNETGFFTNYAYRLRFPSGKLALGIGAGFTVLQGAWHTVQLQEGDDLSFLAPTRSAFRPNFSTGVYYYTKRWFLGASAPFVLAHRYNASREGFLISQARTDLQPMITGGTLFDLSKDLKLKPSALLRYRAESGLQADLSANLIMQDNVMLGVSYRTGDALVAMLEVMPSSQWRIGYAYDVGVSNLRRHHHGSHELMVQYEFGFRIRVRDPRYF
jgi:type IX secretion system PorP/SprF family membrane protein